MHEQRPRSAAVVVGFGLNDFKQAALTDTEIVDMTDAAPRNNNELAMDRSRMASERTLMAWLRTSLSMISFGFTIFKFLEAMQQQSAAKALRPDSPRNVGLALIGIGTVALILACVQHRRYLRVLGPDEARAGLDLPLLVSGFVALLGLLMFVSVVLSWGAFG
jgi:putative membrane protein